MNRKQFVILLVLVVVIGAAGLVIRQRGQSSWQSAGQAIGQKLVPGLPVNDIAQITIKAGGSELNLARRDNVWRVRERSDYPANFSEISGLLLKFADLKVAQTEVVGPSQLGRFELLPPGAGANTATQIEFKDASGKLRDSVLLGKKHMSKPGGGQFGGMGGDQGWPDGRYVMAGGGAKTVSVISDPLDNVAPKPESWLNKDFLRIEKPCRIAVQFEAATNSWTLTRASETNDWQLAAAKAEEKLDSAKVSGVTSPFSSASFNDVAALTASNAPVGTTLTVQTFDGFNYVIKLGASENGNYPASVTVSAQFATERAAAKDEKPEDKARLDQQFKEQQAKFAGKLATEKGFAAWVYQLPGHTVDPLLKPRQELLAEERKETATADGK
jgi:hypothetical protein